MEVGQIPSIAPKLHEQSCHLTIRSSRDRFAARLVRYRVAHRRATAQLGLTQVLGRCIDRLVSGKLSARCLRFQRVFGVDQAIWQVSSRRLAAQASSARRVVHRNDLGFSDGSGETCGKVGFAASHGQRRFLSSCPTIHSSGQTNRCAFGLPLSSGVSHQGKDRGNQVAEKPSNHGFAHALPRALERCIVAIPRRIF